MGVFRKIYSKFKGIEVIEEDFKETGLRLEELEVYENYREVYEKKIRDIEKINKREAKAEWKYLKEDKNIEQIKKRIEKLKEKSRIFI